MTRPAHPAFPAFCLSLLLPLSALAALAPALAPPPPVSPAAEPLLPVLCFHRFGPEKKGDDYQISAKHLDRMLGWLKEHGYQSVKVADALGGFTRTAKPVLISVDDGFESGWTVAGPVFKRWGFTAVYFLHPKLVGKRGRINWSQVHAMEAEGFEIGCHSQWHSNLAKPEDEEDAQAYDARLEDEVVESKRLLEADLKHPVVSFAYPYGAWNSRVESAVRQAGYQLAFTATKGVVRVGDSPMQLKRVLQIGYVGPKAFERSITLRPCGLRLAGLADGQVLRPGTPLSLTLSPEAKTAWPRHIRAWIDRQPLDLRPVPGALAAHAMGPFKHGFHVVRVLTGMPDEDRETQWLFQVATDAELSKLR
jgi:peptidoglycan/xylan/chitin deacetylase (PgdA/CDA1 family)